MKANLTSNKNIPMMTKQKIKTPRKNTILNVVSILIAKLKLKPNIYA